MLDSMINVEKLKQGFKENMSKIPFDHWIFDDFFNDDLAVKLESEFPEYDDKIWYEWSNPLELKKARNDWNSFPPTTYKVIEALNSQVFLDVIAECTNTPKVYSDSGLNGAGWHIHPSGGHNNVHLDYSIHPKLGYQRKFNLIIYLTSGWEDDWGGTLGLYTQDETARKPKDLIKSVTPRFNRAVFFDTTQDSWHGLPEPIACPDGVCRKSIALYYLIPSSKEAEQRGRSLFAPYKEQANDPKVLELIKKRASVSQSKSVYISEKK